MAEKKTSSASKQTGTTTKKPQKKYFKGDLLFGYDEEYLSRVGLLGRTMHRKMRYWCFKIRHAIVEDKKMPETPVGLKSYVEKLPGFAGWENFAVTWDIGGENPFYVVLRLQSVWEEWEAVMNRVAIPINTPPDQINARIAALEDEYAKKMAKKR